VLQALELSFSIGKQVNAYREAEGEIDRDAIARGLIGSRGIPDRDKMAL
jgi:hypothetical protein